MKWFNILMARLRALFRRESVLRDIEEELRIHVEMETETNIERGAPPDEARAAALKSFGNSVRNTELGYDIRGGGWLETLWQDLRYGARTLRFSASSMPCYCARCLIKRRTSWWRSIPRIRGKSISGLFRRSLT